MNRQIDLSQLKRWHTARETAELLGLSTRRVERLCQQGRFKVVDRAGKAYIIYAESIRQFLEAPKPKVGRPRRPGASAASSAASGPAGTP